jgi:hypothetical protein
MRLEMAGEMPNSAAMRADGYGGSTLSIVKLGTSPGFGLARANSSEVRLQRPIVYRGHARTGISACGACGRRALPPDKVGRSD